MALPIHLLPVLGGLLVAGACAPPDVPRPPPVDAPGAPPAGRTDAAPTPAPRPTGVPTPSPAVPPVSLRLGAWVATEGAADVDPPALRYERLHAREGGEAVLSALLGRTADLHACYAALLEAHPEALGGVVFHLDPPVEAGEPVEIWVQSSGTHSPPTRDSGLPGLDDCVRAVVADTLVSFPGWRRGEALGPYVEVAYQLRPRRSDFGLRPAELGPDEEIRVRADGSCEIVRRRTQPCPARKRCPNETTRPGLCPEAMTPP